MSLPYQGRGAYIGAGEESTWGTAVALTRYARATNVGIRRNRTLQRVPHLVAASGSANAQHRFTASDRVSGGFGFLAAYNDHFFGMILKHALGGLATSGAGPYAHVFTPEAALPNGLTLKQGMGTGYSETFEGCQINRLTLSVAANGIMACAVDVIGETSGGAAAVGTATYATIGADNWIQARQGGTLTWNSAAYRLKSLEVVIDNRLSERDQIGSLNSLEPVRSDLQMITVRCGLERLNDVLHTAYLASTEADDGTITFTGSGNESLVIDFHNAALVEYDPPAVSSVGPLEESLTFECLSDGTNEGIEITLNNDNTAAV